jgi:hypothetical protein
MAKAAPAATPPMRTVCKALRQGGAPVKCPFTYPNTARASRVITTDTTSAVDALAKKIYGPSGMNPPTM